MTSSAIASRIASLIGTTAPTIKDWSKVAGPSVRSMTAPGTLPSRTRRCRPAAAWSSGAVSFFLLVALSLFWFFIAGLGALPALLLPVRVRQGEDGLYLFAATWGFGLSLNYALLLLLGPLTAVLTAGTAIALILGSAALWRRRSGFAWPQRWRPWLFAAAVLVVGAIAIVLDPLQDWDARS